VTFFFADRCTRLLRRARRGDRDGFCSLYKELHPRVYAFAARRTRTRADAEDVTARVFQALVEQLPNIDEERGVLPWALAVARNHLIDLARAQRPAAPESDLAAALIEPRTPLGDLLARELLAQLDALPTEDRELIALRHADGLRHKEIARLLGISEAAVRQRLSRARRSLSQAQEGELVHDR
jgi:RNA polymerase sigma-70 factor, ECF subfamily